MTNDVAKLALTVRCIRERLDTLSIPYQTIGQVKGESIWIFARKEESWNRIQAALYKDERSITTFSDSSIGNH